MEKRLIATNVCMNKKLNLFNKLLTTFKVLIHHYPETNEDPSEWETEFEKFKSVLVSNLEEKLMPRFNNINLERYSTDPIGTIFSGFNHSTVNQIISLLNDEIFWLSPVKNSEENLQKRKLLQARRETMEFEEFLAEMICGDNSKFLYRSSYYITKFFKENGFKYEHDGSTRARWVAGVLKELNFHEIYKLVQSLFKKKNFIEHCKIQNHTLEVSIDKAKKEFAQFLNNCIESNEIVNLSSAYNLNVNLELLTNKIISTDDEQFNSIVTKARDFYVEGKKQEALEKLWDAFERLKSILNPLNKKKSSEDLVKLLANEIPEEFFSDEFKKMTEIGNNYMIRHSEVNKQPINDNKSQDYLFFRLLALIDLSISKIPA